MNDMNDSYVDVSIMQEMQKLQNDLEKIGISIQQHEKDITLLQSKRNKMETMNKAEGDMKQLQLLLDNAKGKFEVKKKEFLTFLVEATIANEQKLSDQAQQVRSRSSSSVPTNQQLGSSSSGVPIKLEDD